MQVVTGMLVIYINVQIYFGKISTLLSHALDRIAQGSATLHCANPVSTRERCKLRGEFSVRISA